MKATMFMAVLALFFVSCKKDSFSIPDVTPQPVLQAKIFPAVTEPREATLGDSSSIFTVGERITIYVPYEVSFDDVSAATLIITDETGDTIELYDMISSNHMVSGELNVPMQLQGSNFVFATIELGELYAGKTFSIKTEISGGLTTSDDYLPNAFSVKF